MNKSDNISGKATPTPSPPCTLLRLMCRNAIGSESSRVPWRGPDASMRRPWGHRPDSVWNC